MAIKNSVSNDFLSTFVDSINVFDCRLPGVTKVTLDRIPIDPDKKTNLSPK